MTTRRNMTAGLSFAAASLLTSCGTIFYPDRINQKEPGDLDPAILIADAVGLFFFLIPGIVAFAIDFGTGAIYYPAGHEAGDPERTIFDRDDSQAKLDRNTIERRVGERVGRTIDLGRDDVRAMQIESLDQFWLAHARLAGATLAAR